MHLQCSGLKNNPLHKIAETEAAGGSYKEMLPLMSGKWTKEAYVTGGAQNGLFTVVQSIGLIDDVPTMSVLLLGMVAEAKEKLSAVHTSLGR